MAELKTTATLAETTEFVRKIIGLYNHQRQHQSIGYLPLQMVDTTGIKTEKKWKKYF